MNTADSDELKNRLRPHAIALVEKALNGTCDASLVEKILEACAFLEASSTTESPIVALEQEVHSTTGKYHLFMRRLSSSVPAGKFQILISRDLASGLIY